MVRSLYFFLICIYLINPAAGIETEDDSVKYVFDPIVVTATKIAGAQKNIAASVSVIDEKMISAAPAGSVLELVKNHVPGVNLTERGVMGYGVATAAAGGITIRGVGGFPVTGVLVLRDGRPDIMGMMGHPIPDAYALDGVERIEVVRGPASFLYGTNAMGGVINIVSKKAVEPGFQTRLSGGLGSYESRKLSAWHGARLGAFDYHLTAGLRRTGGHRDFSQYDGRFYSMHLGVRPDRRTDVELNANLADLDLSDPGPFSAPAQMEQWYRIRRSGLDLTLNRRSRLGESYIKLHGNFGRHEIFDGWRSNDYTAGVMLYHNARPWKGAGATLGFDLKQYGGDAEDTENKIPVIDYGAHEMTEYAPYLHLQQLLLQRFILSGGLRIEHHSLYGYETLPKIGLVTHLSARTTLRLSAAKGFRSPAIRELYVFPPRNESLEPERMWNAEIGLSHRIRQLFKIEAVLFRSEGSNMILTDFARRQFINSGEFIHTGYELSVFWHPLSNLELNASWSKLDLEDETLNTPGRKLTLSAVIRYPLLTLGANLVHARNLYGANFRSDPMPDYSLLNLTADLNVTGPVGVRLSLKNALDSEYQTLFDYPMPGRRLEADLSYSF